MLKFLIVLIAISFLSCSDKKKDHSDSTTEILMDSTTIKMKADTTVKMLDHLEDSINQERKKAAEKADQKN